MFLGKPSPRSLGSTVSPLREGTCAPVDSGEEHVPISRRRR